MIQNDTQQKKPRFVKHHFTGNTYNVINECSEIQALIEQVQEVTEVQLTVKYSKASLTKSLAAC